MRLIRMFINPVPHMMIAQNLGIVAVKADVKEEINAI